MRDILRKELRGTLRERRGYLIPMLYMLVLGAVTSMGYASLRALRGSVEIPASDVGRGIAVTVAVLQGIAVMLIAPLVGSSLVAGERERGTWTRLLASPVRRSGILFGKATAGALYLLLILSCSIPEELLAYAYGGIDTPALAGMYFSHAVIASTMVCLGLAVSTVFHRSWVAGLVSLGSSLVLVVLTLTTFVWLTTAATHGSTATGPRLLMDLNPAQTWVLFFIPPSGSALASWWRHLAMMLLLGGASLGFGWFQLRRSGD